MTPALKIRKAPVTALAHENRADLDRLVTSLRQEFDPEGELENFLVD